MTEKQLLKKIGLRIKQLRAENGLSQREFGYKIDVEKSNVSRLEAGLFNTKIFTLYAGLQLLSDSVPALHYSKTADTLYIEGTGNPLFLHPYFKDRAVLDFLKECEEPVALSSGNFHDDRFGPGWSWGDYPYYYSPERDAFPVYGNVVTVYKSRGKIKTVPEYFKDAVKVQADMLRPRDLRRNIFHVPQNLRDTLEIPFILSPELTCRLLSDTLKKKIYTTQTALPRTKKRFTAVLLPTAFIKE